MSLCGEFSRIFSVSANPAVGRFCWKNGAGSGLKLTRPFAFFGKSVLFPRERREAQMVVQFRLKLFTF